MRGENKSISTKPYRDKYSFARDQVKNMASYDSQTRFDRIVEGTF
jgi:hypothetical protein